MKRYDFSNFLTINVQWNGEKRDFDLQTDAEFSHEIFKYFSHTRTITIDKVT